MYYKNLSYRRKKHNVYNLSDLYLTKLELLKFSKSRLVSLRAPKHFNIGKLSFRVLTLNTKLNIPLNTDIDSAIFLTQASSVALPSIMQDLPHTNVQLIKRVVLHVEIEVNINKIYARMGKVIFDVFLLYFF